MMDKIIGFTEDELLPVSALQHFVFCKRQCALIHVEGLWKDNVLTLEGSHLHKRVDDEAPRREVRGDLVILRGLALRSLRLGLVGRADVVELRRRASDADSDGPPDLDAGVPIRGIRGLWTPFPVDYKRGKPKADRCDEVQLCAQALCLEEMLGVHVPVGALFYGRQQRRHAVIFHRELRQATENTAQELHDLIAAGETPLAEKTDKCNRCSLLELCIPEAMRRGRSARRYVESALAEVLGAAEGE